MAAVETISLPLGYLAPPFLLPDTISGRLLSTEDVRGNKGLLVMFICNHCPYVKHILHTLIAIAKKYQPLGIRMVAISSNDVLGYPEDSPEKMQSWGQALEFPFPYLYDESQEVAKAYAAACTPDFSLFDKNLHCTYRGQLDGSRPSNNIPCDGNELIKALDALLADLPPIENQKPSIGCSIKWKNT